MRKNDSGIDLAFVLCLCVWVCVRVCFPKHVLLSISTRCNGFTPFAPRLKPSRIIYLLFCSPQYYLRSKLHFHTKQNARAVPLSFKISIHWTVRETRFKYCFGTWLGTQPSYFSQHMLRRFKGRRNIPVFFCCVRSSGVQGALNPQPVNARSQFPYSVFATKNAGFRGVTCELVIRCAAFVLVSVSGPSWQSNTYCLVPKWWVPAQVAIVVVWTHEPSATGR